MIAAALRDGVARQVSDLKIRGTTPGLAVILIGDDSASDIYVRHKIRACAETGIASFEHRRPAETSEADLLGLIDSLNVDLNVHGILLQLPLPPHLNAAAAIMAIDPAKDVDGLHPLNAGRLISGLPGLVPCTPQGSLLLVRDAVPDPSGLHAVVLGRSILFGKPMAQLLLAAHCTVTHCHSYSRDLPGLCLQADILVAAIGRAGFVPGDWVKPGATVIDVGITRLADGTLRGDVNFDQAKGVAGAITPVPGGVGPMTIACLLANTVKAAGGTV